MTTDSTLAQGNSLLQEGAYPAAVRSYLNHALAQDAAEVPGLAIPLEGSLTLARELRLSRRRSALRQGRAPRIAVCGWELGHNAAGRALALAEAHAAVNPHVEIIGTVLPHYGEQLWPPMQGSRIPVHPLLVRSHRTFLRHALKFVLQRPYDVVHLSKPRWTTLIFGLLYELIWGAKVIWDIDDEELGFVGAEKPLTPAEAFGPGEHSRLTSLRAELATRVAVSQATRFDEVTVSNPALQQRYGGSLLPHLRHEDRFIPSPERTRRARRTWDIPEDATVVLFSGTPRKHKGLLKVARALASLERQDIWLVVAGDFTHPRLRRNLESVRGLNLRLIPGQPLHTLPEITALGDYTVLLQDQSSLAAQYQLPAKLMDSLAMGHVVFTQVTPATQWLAEAGVVLPVTSLTLEESLRTWLEDPGRESGRRSRAREFFLEHLSISSAQPLMKRLQEIRPSERPSWEGKLLPLLRGSQEDFVLACTRP